MTGKVNTNALFGGRELLLILGSRANKVTGPLHSVGCKYRLIRDKKGGFAKFVVVLKIAYVLVSHRPLVLSDYPGWLSLFALLFCKLLRLPFVLRLRGDVWLEFNHAGIIKRKIRCAIGDCHLRHSTKILPVSLFLAGAIASRKQVDNAKVRVIPIPNECGKDIVNIHDVQHLRLVKEKHRYLLLTLTNFNFQGKVVGLLEFLPILDELISVKKMDISWVIIGHGKYYKSFIEEVSKFPNLTVHIYMMGYIQNANMLMTFADLVVYFSKEDASSNVILESMCSGKVTVVNDYPALMEIVSDGETGIVVETSRISLAASAIEDVLLDVEKANLIGAKAKVWVGENFNCLRIGKEFIDVLSEVV